MRRGRQLDNTRGGLGGFQNLCRCRPCLALGILVRSGASGLACGRYGLCSAGGLLRLRGGPDGIGAAIATQNHHVQRLRRTKLRRPALRRRRPRPGPEQPRQHPADLHSRLSPFHLGLRRHLGREHQWPVSLLGTDDPSNSYKGMESDEFLIRPINPSVNSSRGNSPYGMATSSGANGYQTAGYYYVGDADSGDCARAMFYAVTEYPTFNGHSLSLVSGQPATYQMGDLNSLLHWNYSDPPDAFERRRNQAVFSPGLNPTYYQGNRNAYIDHPEWVWSVFVNQDNDTSITTNTHSVDLGRVIVGSSFGTQSVTINKAGMRERITKCVPTVRPRPPSPADTMPSPWTCPARRPRPSA